MNKKFKKIISSLLPLVLALVFVTGTFEVGEMLGAPAITSYVLGSDGDYTPPSPTPAKKANTMKVKGKTVELKATTVAKKKQTIARSKAIKLSSAKGTVTYKKKSGNKKITINKKTGKITVKKGLKKGTYKVKINVKAAGNASYKSKSSTVTVKIKVVTVVNPMTVAGKTVNISGADLVSADKAIPIGTAMTIKKPQGKLTYSLSSTIAGITINSTTGEIKVPQGTPAGTYVIEVSVKAAGNKKYKSSTQIDDVTIVVTSADASAA